MAPDNHNVHALKRVLVLTFVIARKFRQEITVIAMDTMISSRGDTVSRALPGRLKGVVLNTKVSIAFANGVNEALLTIRRSKRHLDRGGSLAGVLEILEAEPSADFIVASHMEGQQLFAVKEGRRSADLPLAWLGDGSVAQDFAHLEAQYEPPPGDISLYSCEELAFRHTFYSMFNKGIHLSETVGGLPVFLLASPNGHTYDDMAASRRWDTIVLEPGASGGVSRLPSGGMSSWSYSLVSARKRGVAVLGAALPEAGLAYIYAPLDEATDVGTEIAVPVHVRLTDQSTLTNVVEDIAKKFDR